jgi:NADPH:quinone reductase-like Zn-dependent oxidoreductase
VLVRGRAAGVDQGVWHLMTGLPYLVRLAGYGLRAPKKPVLGYDVAGTVDAVGEDVAGLRPDDAVFGTCEGSFAEYACAHADRLARKPANLSFEQAAAPSRAAPRSRPSATGGAFGRALACSSSARAAAWGRSRCSSPRRTAAR